MADLLSSGSTRSDPWQRQEQCLARFEAAWQSTTPPELAQFLHEVGEAESASPNFLQELVKLDLDYRWRRAFQQGAATYLPPGHVSGATPATEGEPWPLRPLIEDYTGRFPSLGSAAEAPLDLVAEEYRVRRRWGDHPRPEEYTARFPAHADAIPDTLSSIDADLTAEATGEGRDRRRTIGRYELIEQVGQGGFGVVWKAWDPHLRREIAVKIPRHGRWLTPQDEKRFLREARATARLNHPGIVSVFDVGRDGETVFLVTELVRGVTLQQFCRNQLPDLRQAAEIAARIAEALHRAHDSGVVHRDIKPSNIMLEGYVPPPEPGKEAEIVPPPIASTVHAHAWPEQEESDWREFLPYRPRIMDFGLAKRDAGETTMTQDGHLLGTPAYMSPEQIRDPHKVDRRSDVYSLGVVLYQMLAGLVPFEGEVHTVLANVQAKAPPPPSSLSADVPPGLEAITLKCLAKDPADRYWTAGELADDLRRWLANESLRADAAPTAIEVTSNPAFRILLLLALILFGAVAGTLAQPWLRAIGIDLQLPWVAAVESPLNQLKGEKVPAEEQFPWQPTELMAIAGEHRQRQWEEVTALAFHPEKKLVATGGPSGLVQLWSSETQKPLYSLEGLRGEIRSLAFSRDGRILAAASDDTAHTWEFKNNELVTRDVIHGSGADDGEVTALALDPAGEWLATAMAGGKVRLWDVKGANPSEKGAFDLADVSQLAFSRDGQHLGAAAGQKLMIWRREGNEFKPRFELGGNDFPEIHCLTFSHDQQRVVAGGATGGIIVPLDVEKPEMHVAPLETSGITSLAFSPTERLLAVGTASGTIQCLDLSTAEPRPRHTLRGHAGPIRALSFSENSGSLISGGDDHTWRQWDVARQSEVRALQPMVGAVSRVRFVGAREANIAALARSNELLSLWQVREGALIERDPLGEPGLLRQIAFSRDAKYILTADDAGAIKTWDADSGRRLATFARNLKDVHVAEFTDDAKAVLLATAAGEIALWDLAADNEKTIRLPKSEQAPTAIAFSHDGQRAGLGFTDGRILILDLADPKNERWVTHTANSPIHTLAFFPGSHLLASLGEDRRVVVWNTDTGDSKATVAEHPSRASTLTLGPMGRMGAIVGDDGTARVWDASTGRVLATFRVSSGSDAAAAFSPDGQSLVVAGSDGKVVLWNVQRERLLHQWSFPGRVHDLAFSSDSRHLALANGNGTVYVVRVGAKGP